MVDRKKKASAKAKGPAPNLRGDRFRVVSIDKLVKADWNYKTDDHVLSAKLAENIKRNGQVENLIVRQLDTGFLEVVNGNHRLDVMLDLGMTECMVCDVGAISQAAAQRLAIETNETRFVSDHLKLSALLAEISEEFPLIDLQETLPYSETDLDSMIQLANFDWSKYGESAPDETRDAGAMMAFRLVISAEAWGGVVSEAILKLSAALEADGRSLSTEQQVRLGQALELLAAEYMAGK